MRREDIRLMVAALRDLDRFNHQPFADLVGREFARRPAPEKRCPHCGGPIDGWLMIGAFQVVYCRLCTSFEEAYAHAADLEDQRQQRIRDDRNRRRRERYAAKRAATESEDA